MFIIYLSTTILLHNDFRIKHNIMPRIMLYTDTIRSIKYIRF